MPCKKAYSFVGPDHITLSLRKVSASSTAGIDCFQIDDAMEKGLELVLCLLHHFLILRGGHISTRKSLSDESLARLYRRGSLYDDNLARSMSLSSLPAASKPLMPSWSLS